MIAVILSDEDIALAETSALERDKSSRSGGMDRNKHAAKSDIGTDLHGCASEIALARYFGLVDFVPAINQHITNEPDVRFEGVEYEVRSTETDGGHLILRPIDKRHIDRTFVLAYTHEYPPTVHLIGRMLGLEGMRRRFYREPDGKGIGACWVPGECLAQFNGAYRELFLHRCHCGNWGAFGYGVALIRGEEGNWFCREHRPTQEGAHYGVTGLSTGSVERDQADIDRGASPDGGADADRSRQDTAGGGDRQRRKRQKEASDFRGTGDLFGRSDC